MKHISIISALGISATVLFFCGCAQYDASQIAEMPEALVVAHEPAPDSIFANSFELTRIAERTLGISANSRGSELQISEVPDSAGNPALYIMQCGIDNGFVIASARKSYWPVLAYSEDGSFSNENEMPAPVKEWLENMTEQVATSANEPSIEEAKSAWQMYGNHFIPSSSSRSTGRSSDNSDAEYWAEITALSHILNDSIMSWQSQGYDAGLLVDFRGIDENLREQWITEAQNGVFPPYTDEWMYLAAVRVGGASHADKTGFELNCKWHQDYPFNQSFPLIWGNTRALVGCGNIAMGLIMHYHQWPATYNWDNMPLNAATTTTSEFLYDLAISNNSTFKLNATSTNLYNIDYSLNHIYGYHAKMYEFDYNVLRKNLNAYKPVICTNYYLNESGQEDGHAWVVSGTSRAILSSSIELWYFASRRTLEKKLSDGTAGTGPLMYYVNWGWGTTDNGYYIDIEKAYPLSSSAEMKGMEIEIYPLK